MTVRIASLRRALAALAAASSLVACATETAAPGEQETFDRAPSALLGDPCTLPDLTVTSVTPQGVPNVGGTRVDVYGTGFDTTGRTAIGLPPYGGKDVRCDSTTHCSFTTLPAALTEKSIFSNIDVTVGGCTPVTLTPLVVIQGGPWCTATLSCDGIVYGPPEMTIACPQTVSFYDPDGVKLAAGTTFSEQTNDPGIAITACFGDRTTSSCTLFSGTVPSSNWCGTPPPPPPPPPSCEGAPRPTRACGAGWRCCGSDGWACGVCG